MEVVGVGTLENAASPGQAARQPLLEHLWPFVAAADTGSMTAAGPPLGYSQPAISLHVTAPGRQVGAHLFARHAGGLDLTGEGAELISKARQLLRRGDSI